MSTEINYVGLIGFIMFCLIIIVLFVIGVFYSSRINPKNNQTELPKNHMTPIGEP